MFTTCDTKCYKLTTGTCVEVDELKSPQEEADSRMFLHAKHVAETHVYKAIIITSDDTHVLVLALGYSAEITLELYQKAGTALRQTLTNISMLANSIGSNVCAAIISLHAFTGCDTTSAFAGRGKLAALKLLHNEPPFQDTFSRIGES